jgi:pyrimidine operon attenuation protein/uracil phosphoribosyltransferase
MDNAAVRSALKRIAHEILERNGGCENICFVGIKNGGIPIAQILADNIYEIEGMVIPVGVIDTKPHRDDRSDLSLYKVSGSELPFDVSGKKVIIVDDVLCTGRTARAAMEAVISFGRPDCIQLAILVDRGHRELPIRGDYVGKNIPTAKSEAIVVRVEPQNASVKIFGL